MARIRVVGIFVYLTTKKLLYQIKFIEQPLGITIHLNLPETQDVEQLPMMNI